MSFFPDIEHADWQDDALCSTPTYAKQRDLWFPTPGDTRTAGEAKRVCQACPVIYLCRAWSLQQHEDVGIWGGLSERERRQIHRRPAKKKVPGGSGIVRRRAA